MERPRSVAARLEQALPSLRERYPLGRVRLYGSVAREEATSSSDVDLLVEFTRTPSLFEMARLQAELEELLGRRVDLATPGGLHPRVLAQAEADAVPLRA